MATTRTRAKTTDTEPPVETPPVQEAPAPTLNLRRSEGIRKQRETTQNSPLLAAAKEYVTLTLTEGALALDAVDEEEAKKLVNLLRTAAGQLGYGLDITPLRNARNADGTYSIDFRAREGKRKRAYTDKDIKAWFLANKGETFTGRIPAEKRDEFKKANGYS